MLRFLCFVGVAAAMSAWTSLIPFIPAALGALAGAGLRCISSVRAAKS